MSQTISSGSGRTTSCTKSQVSSPATRSSAARTIARMRGSSSRTTFGVKACSTRRRISVWRGGSSESSVGSWSV